MLAHQRHSCSAQRRSIMKERSEERVLLTDSIVEKMIICLQVDASFFLHPPACFSIIGNVGHERR